MPQFMNQLLNLRDIQLAYLQVCQPANRQLDHLKIQHPTLRACQLVNQAVDQVDIHQISQQVDLQAALHHYLQYPRPVNPLISLLVNRQFYRRFDLLASPQVNRLASQLVNPPTCRPIFLQILLVISQAYIRQDSR